MVYRDREVRAQFSQPVRQIVVMMIIVGAFCAGSYLIYPQVAPVFLASPWLNGTIGFVFVIGVLACFLQVFQLISSISWIEDFARARPGHEARRPPRLLAPLAALLSARGARMQISATSSRSILDSVATRLDEARDITRYIVNLLIFLGLLGTFYGLATTVPAVVDTIRSLAPQEGESSTVVFARLIGGLEKQLGGMGTAFASSLLGLAGSLVVGLLELFAGHGQNRFYRELEEWLSTITRLGFSSGDAELGPEQAMFATMIENMTEQVDGLHTTMREAESGRMRLDAKLGELTEALTLITRRYEEDSSGVSVLTRVADGQDKLVQSLEQIVAKPAEEIEATEVETRMRLRSIDVQLLRLLEELSAGREESVTELRRDLARLTRVIEIAASDPSSAASPGDSDGPGR